MYFLKNLFETILVKRAPAMPLSIKSFLVVIAPWLIILSIIFALPALSLLLGIKALLPSFFYYQAVGATNFTLVLVIEVLALIFNTLALPGLFKKSISGWNWVYYAILIQTIAGLVSGHMISGLLSLVISMYILFQVRNYYH